jgi:hypothetical protein
MAQIPTWGTGQLSAQLRDNRSARGHRGTHAHGRQSAGDLCVFGRLFLWSIASHRRGHWFDPSIAHGYCALLTCGFRGAQCVLGRFVGCPSKRRCKLRRSGRRASARGGLAVLYRIVWLVPGRLTPLRALRPGQSACAGAGRVAQVVADRARDGAPVHRVASEDEGATTRSERVEPSSGGSSHLSVAVGLFSSWVRCKVPLADGTSFAMSARRECSSTR